MYVCYKGRDLLVGCVLVEIVDELKGKKKKRFFFSVIMVKREHFQQVLTTFRYNICFFFMVCLKLEPYFFDGSKDFIFCNQNVDFFFLLHSMVYVHTTL